MLNAVSTSSLLSTPRAAVTNLQSQLSQAEYEISSGEIADPVTTLGDQIGLDECCAVKRPP